MRIARIAPVLAIVGCGGRIAADPGLDTGAYDTATPPLDTHPVVRPDTLVPDVAPPPVDAIGDSACGAMSTNVECQKCCGTNHTEAYKAFVETLLGCACKPGNCDVDCKTTACASPPASPDAMCNACLTKVQTTACKADLDSCAATKCSAFLGCVEDQGCTTKP